MSASAEESAMLPASGANSSLGKHATSPGVKVGTEDRVTVKKSKRSKQRTRKGQRVDLRSLLHGPTDETQKTDNVGQHEEMEQEIAGLGIRSNELPTTKQYSIKAADKTQAASNVTDGEALAETTATVTGYAYNDDNSVNYASEYDDFDSLESDSCEDGTSNRAIKLPTQSRPSKKGKGNRFQFSVGRKDLVGARDGPLALPSHTNGKKSKKARQKMRKEAIERERVEERQRAEVRGGLGRMIGAE